MGAVQGGAMAGRESWAEPLAGGRGGRPARRRLRAALGTPRGGRRWEDLGRGAAARARAAVALPALLPSSGDERAARLREPGAGGTRAPRLLSWLEGQGLARGLLAPSPAWGRAGVVAGLPSGDGIVGMSRAASFLHGFPQATPGWSNSSLPARPPSLRRPPLGCAFPRPVVGRHLPKRVITGREGPHLLAALLPAEDFFQTNYAWKKQPETEKTSQGHLSSSPCSKVGSNLPPPRSCPPGLTHLQSSPDGAGRDYPHLGLPGRVHGLAPSSAMV